MYWKIENRLITIINQKFVLFFIFCSTHSFLFHIIYLPLFVLLQKDVDFECREEKKQHRGSTSAKRSRAAEVHNLSERVCTYIMSPQFDVVFLIYECFHFALHAQKRRDRINEKMKALQELIPRCNKVTLNNILLCWILLLTS